MTSKHTPPKTQSKNSTCRLLGHDWMTGVAANWRVCRREECRASERLVNDQWVSNAKAYRFHDPVVEYGRRKRQPRQGSMWETE